jgi:hypothetical protein
MPEIRHWYWPFYRTTQIAFIAVTTILLAANYLAVTVPTPCLEDGKYGPDFPIIGEYNHGWPLAYSTRHRWQDPNPSRSGNFQQFSPWRLWEGVKQLSYIALSIDVLIGATAIAAVCAGVQWWRFRHQKSGQFTIQDLLAALSALALVLAWVANTRFEHSREGRLLKEQYRRLDDPNRERFSIHTRAPKRLGFLSKDYEQHFDQETGRVVEFSGDRDIACQFPQLLAYSTWGPAKDTLVECLTKMPQLEGLDLIFSGFHKSEDGVLNQGLSHAPALRRLKGINLHDTGVNDEDLIWLSKCTQLETAYFHAEDGLTDNGIRHLSQLPRLKRLGIDSRREECQITDLGCRAIANMKNLESLFLEGNQITDNGVEEFVRLKKLKRLWLWTSATAATTARLRQQMPWCEVRDLAAEFRRDYPSL